MPQMFSFSVSVHLDSLFTDKRSRCKLYVSNEHLETAGDFLLKVRKLFNINEPIDLYIKDFESLYYIPPGEDVRILQSNNVIVVKRNCNEVFKDEETFYKCKIKKRKRTLSLEYKNEDDAKDDTVQVKEKGKKKDKTNEKDLNSTSEITKINVRETINTEKKPKDVTLSNEGYSKNSEQRDQNDTEEEAFYNDVAHMETDQQKQITTHSDIFNNIKDCDYRKVYNPSYSSTSFKALGTMATSRKHMFTERKPIETLKISTIPKLIRPVKVVDKETPKVNNQIQNTKNISDNSLLNKNISDDSLLTNSLEILEDDLNKINNKSSLELPQKLTEHFGTHELSEEIATETENSLANMNSTPILIDSSVSYTDIKEETDKCDDYFTANFVTKRKRKRHRKKKSCVSKQTQDYCEFSQLNEIPRTSVKPSAPLMHIKFSDDDHHQTKRNDERRDSSFENETSPSKIEKNTFKDATLNNIDNTLNEKSPIKKPEAKIKILNDIKICDSFTKYSNGANKTFTNVINNRNKDELLNSDFNNTTNCIKTIFDGKLKTRTVPKCNDKSRISTAMQRAINNYFKDLNGSGKLKKETTTHSDSSDDSSKESSSPCNDAKSNSTKNYLKSKNCLTVEENPTTLNESQLNGNAEKVQHNVNILNGQHLEECTVTTTKEVFCPFSVSESDILKKSLMYSKPMKDNIIAFKTVVLTENYTPEVSKFIIAKVLDFQAADNTIRFYVLNGGDQLNQPKGKFSLEEDTEEAGTKEVTYKWEDILEPRLLYP